MWIPQLNVLGECYHALAIDLPGHGSCAHLPLRFDLAMQTISEVIKRVGKRLLLVGLSLGGFIVACVLTAKALRLPD
jgi:pimeloyl-ACP methyl ester carboxylesterase